MARQIWEIGALLFDSENVNLIQVAIKIINSYASRVGDRVN